MAQIAVIGAGYVGLTTAACFSHLGHDVVCADVNAERVAQLTKGEVLAIMWLPGPAPDIPRTGRPPQLTLPLHLGLC